MSKILEQKIINKTAKISVIGLGYVGLPLAISFAKVGFKVYGLDIDKDRVGKINRSISYITDISSEDLRKLQKKNRLEVSTDFTILKEVDVVIICVPTPMKSRNKPDISFIINAVKKIKQFLVGTKLIILESTTYPGMTDEAILPKLEFGGLRCGRDFYLVFSPERIDPGNKIYNVNKIAKIVGGVTRYSSKLAKLLYGQIIKKVIIVSSAKTAEAVKLLENTFRIINIGLINEMLMMAHKLNIDIWEVIEAAKTKPFGFMPFYPGPGVGGHCIPEDPLYLYWKAKLHGFKSRFIKLASELNSSMPMYVVERLEEILRKDNKNLKDAKILIIGVTYKKDVKDLRKSPALDIIELLQEKYVRVSYFDPYIPYLKFKNINLRSIKLAKNELSNFDCVVITTAHSKVDYTYVLKHSKIIFDTRNVFKNIKGKKIIRL